MVYSRTYVCMNREMCMRFSLNLAACICTLVHRRVLWFAVYHSENVYMDALACAIVLGCSLQLGFTTIELFRQEYLDFQLRIRHEILGTG